MAIELHVPELGLRFDLPLSDLDGDSDATEGKTPVTRETLAEGEAVTASPPGACLAGDFPALPGITGPVGGWASQVGRAGAESPLGALRGWLQDRRTASTAVWAKPAAGGASKGRSRNRVLRGLVRIGMALAAGEFPEPAHWIY